MASVKARMRARRSVAGGAAWATDANAAPGAALSRLVAPATRTRHPAPLLVAAPAPDGDGGSPRGLDGMQQGGRRGGGRTRDGGAGAAAVFDKGADEDEDEGAAARDGPVATVAMNFVEPVSHFARLPPCVRAMYTYMHFLYIWAPRSAYANRHASRDHASRYLCVLPRGDDAEALLSDPAFDEAVRRASVADALSDRRRRLPRRMSAAESLSGALATALSNLAQVRARDMHSRVRSYAYPDTPRGWRYDACLLRSCAYPNTPRAHAGIHSRMRARASKCKCAQVKQEARGSGFALDATRGHPALIGQVRLLGYAFARGVLCIYECSDMHFRMVHHAYPNDCPRTPSGRARSARATRRCDRPCSSLRRRAAAARPAAGPPPCASRACPPPQRARSCTRHFSAPARWCLTASAHRSSSRPCSSWTRPRRRSTHCPAAMRRPR